MEGQSGDVDQRARTDPRDDVVFHELQDALAWARDREYTGWDYADGMSSRIRRALPVENRWVNLAFQETAKRSPVNLRPLLLVERRRSFMGAGLFAMANLTVDRLLCAWPGADAEPGVDHVGEAVELLDWLVANRSRGYRGFCGSHQHKTQSLTSTGDTNTPSVVSTAPPARAMLRAAPVDPVYPAVAETAAEFVVEDLDYREIDGEGAVIKYLPSDTGDHLTPNAVAVGARLLTDLAAHTGDEALADRAGRLLDRVVALQTDTGGWHYRHPPETSHLSMDNFHNGFILESLLRYERYRGTGRHADAIDDALAFHREVLFEESGAPNWDESTTYPRDIHASAQGGIVFSQAGEFDRARRIIEWALSNLSNGDGRFYFRKHRRYTTRTTLMRWCQAWMTYAMSEYLRHRHLAERP